MFLFHEQRDNLHNQTNKRNYLRRQECDQYTTIKWPGWITDLTWMQHLYNFHFVSCTFCLIDSSIISRRVSGDGYACSIT